MSKTISRLSMAATSRNAAGVIRQTTPRHPDNLSNLNICAVPAAAAIKHSCTPCPRAVSAPSLHGPAPSNEWGPLVVSADMLMSSKLLGHSNLTPGLPSFNYVFRNIGPEETHELHLSLGINQLQLIMLPLGFSQRDQH